MKNHKTLLGNREVKAGKFFLSCLPVLFLFLLLIPTISTSDEAGLYIGTDDPSMPRVVISPVDDVVYMFAFTNNTIPVIVAGTWYNITFDEEEYALTRGITHTYNDSTNASFYVDKTGVYKVFGSVSFINSNVAAEDQHMVYRIIKNGVEVHGSFWEGDFTLKDTETKRNYETLVECSAGDSLGLQFTADNTGIDLIARDSTGYGDEHGHSATIIIERIA